MSYLKYCPTIRVVKPTKQLKNKGINIMANGIKNLKFSSKVKEIDIQYRLIAKKPKPNNHP